MGLDGVEQVYDGFSTVVRVGLAGSDGSKGGPLTVAQLRRRFHSLSGLGSAGYILTAGERRLVAQSLGALRSRLERFNRRVPAGLKVELNPALTGWPTEALRGEA